MIALPRLYPILDAACFPDPKALYAAAEQLTSAGVTLIQYRNKFGNARVMLEQARELKRCFLSESHFSQNRGEVGHPTSEESTQDQNPHPKIANHAILGWGTHGGVRLIMNDRADLCLAADFDGVHVGQQDLSPESARKIIGWGEQGNVRWLGISTHNPEQVGEADQTSADYVAIGPVFATASKANPDPVVGLEGVGRARQLTRKPLVAIGGVTRSNARSLIDAGADSVAVISDLLRDPGKSAEEFLRILG
jgi:thiamine-phosphate pyrophosphorylase